VSPEPAMPTLAGETAAAPFPRALAEYADRLLLGTGLDATAALLIASGQLDPRPDLNTLADAVRAGWNMTEDTL
jgi:hypothetical protein